MISLETNTDHSAVFEISPKSFVDYKSYSMYSQGFLSKVIDIMVICIKFTHSDPFCSLIPKMSMFTLAISSLFTSNLTLFMDLTSEVPMQYFSLQHQSNPQLGIAFALGPSLHSFWLFHHSSPVAYWAPTDRGSSSLVPYLFVFFQLFVGFSRLKYLSGLRFPSPMDHVCSELSTMTDLSCVALHGMTQFR